MTDAVCTTIDRRSIIIVAAAVVGDAAGFIRDAGRTVTDTHPMTADDGRSVSYRRSITEGL